MFVSRIEFIRSKLSIFFCPCIRGHRRLPAEHSPASCLYCRELWSGGRPLFSWYLWSCVSGTAAVQLVSVSVVPRQCYIAGRSIRSNRAYRRCMHDHCPRRWPEQGTERGPPTDRSRDGHHGYMSRKNTQFRTDKVDSETSRSFDSCNS